MEFKGNGFQRQVIARAEADLFVPNISDRARSRRTAASLTSGLKEISVVITILTGRAQRRLHPTVEKVILCSQGVNRPQLRAHSTHVPKTISCQ